MIDCGGRVTNLQVKQNCDSNEFASSGCQSRRLLQLFLVAQWLERWCASLASQVPILVVTFRVSYNKGEPIYLAAAFLHNLVL